VGDVLKVAELIGAAIDLLWPVVLRVATAMAAGKDPVAELANERLEDIIPAELRLAAARKAERARRGLPGDP
jgi:hypothetical protein